MKNLSFIFIAFYVLASSCKQEPSKLKYNFSVSEYLLRTREDDSDPTKEKIYFKIMRRFMIDSSVFYYSETGPSADVSSSLSEEDWHCKNLDANDIIALNKIMDSIPSLDKLEYKRDKGSLYEGPDYTLVYNTGRTEKTVHFIVPSKAIKALFEFGKKLDSTRKMTKADSVEMAEINNLVAKDAIRRMPPATENMKFVAPAY